MKQTLQGKRILAIDDTPAILTFLRVSLETLGAEFHEAQTASYGLALCEELKPDLIVLDLGLPDKEGMNILPRLKRMDKKSASPIVIVLTVRNEQRYKDMARDLGADAYVTKPFRMENLLELMHEKLGVTLDEELASVVAHLQAS